jgi:hypothetical protein
MERREGLMTMEGEVRGGMTVGREMVEWLLYGKEGEESDSGKGWRGMTVWKEMGEWLCEGKW